MPVRRHMRLDSNQAYVCFLFFNGKQKEIERMFDSIKAEVVVAKALSTDYYFYLDLA